MEDDVLLAQKLSNSPFGTPLTGMIDLSPSSLIAGMIFGIIGLYVFRYGKKILDYRIIGIGIALMVYPYFTKGPMQDWGVGVSLCGLGYYLKDH